MSLSPAVLDAMLASGCTAEQIVAAVKAASGEDLDRQQARRAADAARKRAERAAVRNRPAESTGQTRTDEDGDGLLSSPEVFPQTPFPNPSNPKPPSAPKGASSPTFEQFWAVYPHKVGKPDAAKAFQRAGQRVDFETLMAGLRRYVAKTDDRPWCNPSTWLNQDRWGDQPAAVQPRGSPARPDTPVDVADRLLNELRFANGHSDPPSDSNSQALVAFPGRAYAGQR